MGEEQGELILCLSRTALWVSSIRSEREGEERLVSYMHAETDHVDNL